MIAAHVVEVHVDTVGCSLAQHPRHRAVLVVERRIEAVAAGEQRDLLVAARAADHPARTAKPCDLAHCGSDRPGSCRHEDSVARLHLGDHEKTDPGRERGEAERTQIDGWRDPRHFLSCSKPTRVTLRDIPPALKVLHKLSHREIGGPRLDHPAHGIRVHHLVEREGRHIRLDVVHAPAHIGVDGDEKVLYPHLVFGERREVHRDESHIAGGRFANGPICEVPLAAGSKGGHERLRRQPAIVVVSSSVPNSARVGIPNSRFAPYSP